jgi:hypothetical protein
VGLPHGHRSVLDSRFFAKAPAHVSLINHTVELLDKLIHLASNPFMRPLRKQALRLLDELRDAAESIDDDDDPDKAA